MSKTWLTKEKEKLVREQQFIAAIIERITGPTFFGRHSTTMHVTDKYV